ncbi:hypothetical protein METBIDRAFT_11601 [Metschnikowia bicuspidata var. bicuspidata NRRL YB-4993]|uniref:N-(5'-phosphoribosyl)anthranilate isomerase n=1 Tax=Metschnikowia bicuspidata var. bicuspidata NRRL YB-4993 TaxID=869754 RepID=A0A1A0HAV1_9ASCO|nr:hypothetical protein METBIDRAFT_11601 [Metschnikowia bicuspidata var. bicuspidata NRRL YB-4993]OBA21013.1 hypothetical protein METBIDRAFT_11601 [Metschnikowia bicuspidata var. bicuspidata NRRL YB-4993]
MPPLVKICGLRSTEAAQKAIDSGADMLGVIMVPNRKRTVSPGVALEIAKACKKKRKELGRQFQTAGELTTHLSSQKFASHIEYFEAAARLVHENGPFLVGVFRNQGIEDVFGLARDCAVDIIQLHGSEEAQGYLRYNDTHGFGIIKRYVIPDHVDLMAQFFPHIARAERGFLLPLLDSEAGGEGKTIEWPLINGLDGRFLLAGGLDPSNVAETRPFLRNVVGFDVSGGVEDGDGQKNMAKIEAFVANAKQM